MKKHMKKLIEYHDFALEDSEIYVNPILMEGYEPPVENLTLMEKFNRLSVNTRGLIVGITLGVVYGVIGFFQISK